MKTSRGARGFTLLEATVAMAMLATSLIGLYYVNYGAMQNHAYSKQLTVASLLARSKMVDLEQKLYDDGLKADDEEQDGDFSDEGWPSFKWRATIIAPKTEGLPPEQLLAALFNIPMGGGDDKNNPGGSKDPLSAMAAMFMGGAGGLPGGATGGALPGGAGGLGGMLGGAMSGMMQGQFTQLVDTITKSVREVHLTVYWKDGKNVESFDVVTHVVSMGPGSDRNGGAGLGSSSAATSQAQNQDQLNRPVDSVSGAPCAQGQTTSPAGNPCIPMKDFLASHGGTGAAGGGIQGLPGQMGGVNPYNGNNRMFGGSTTISPFKNEAVTPGLRSTQ